MIDRLAYHSKRLPGKDYTENSTSVSDMPWKRAPHMMADPVLFQDVASEHWTTFVLCSKRHLQILQKRTG